MSYSGDIRLGSTIDVKFTTASFGVPTSLLGTPAVAAYPDNSLTEVTAGITLSVDFDSRTGLNNVRIVATNGNGYATATNYDLVITAGTVAGSSVVGYTVGSFSIEDRSALMPTTAARTLDVSSGGEAGVDWANVGSPTTTNGLTGTTISSAQIVASVTGAVGSVTGAVGSVTGNVGGNVTGSVGSVVGNVGGNVTGSVGSVVGAVGSVTGAVGSVTGNVGGNVVGSVGSLTTNNDKTGYTLSSAGIIAVWAYVVEGSFTAVQFLRGIAASTIAKLSGAATTTVTIRDVSDTKDRIVATVDADGNRTAETLDLS